MTHYSKRYLKLAPICVFFTNIRSQSIINNGRGDSHNSGHIYIKPFHNKGIEQACHTITQSMQNSTVLEPLILYLYITSSTGVGL